MKTKTVRRNLFVALVALALFAGVWYFVTHKYVPKQKPILIASRVQPARPLTAFNLYDDSGEPFTQQSLLGHWTLLFFGYPACPDICPQTLGLISDAWDEYTSPPAKFVFASITPEPAETGNLKNFVKGFNPDFVGVSGTPAALQQLSAQLGIYVEQKPDRIDHTTSLMLIDPQGRLTAVITPPFTADQLVTDLNALTGRKVN
jgi:protein SCO1/2